MCVAAGNPGRFGVAANPDNDQGPFNSIWVGGAGNIVVRQLNGDVTYKYRHDSLPGIPVPGGTDVALRVSQVSTNGLSIAGGFLVLFKRLDRA